MVTRVTGVRVQRRSGSHRAVLAIGVCAAALAYVIGRGARPSEPQPRTTVFVPEFDAVELPVPERAIAAGTLVRDIPIRSEKFPGHQLPRGVVRDLGRFRDGVVLTALPGGLPIIESNIGSADEVTNPVIGSIPPGMRAMTVRVDATAAVEGWARTGSIVDVLLVEKNKTTVIAEKVRVLSTERSTSLVENDTGSAIPSTVTLLVTQEQCLAINTAVPLGKIAFALRSSRDGENWRSTRYSADDLSGVRRDAPPARIGGVVSYESGGEKKTYALVDNMWISSDTAPPGFFAGAPREGN